MLLGIAFACPVSYQNTLAPCVDSGVKVFNAVANNPQIFFNSLFSLSVFPSSTFTVTILF
ncbi:MAG: hypothetical protein EZS26_003278 [Candidatus Ordinivivax streblomastigis]|uniref:Uncharacterized protein n=1 Tax=Candidatus Ordinivivax streblomastigis TaxID=2540710 RepID=A0A5M8NXT0_9BACT|nr:MAG: hypothetical protein EZS26_003278 [Candidatus Ordinivivax streblomastigis]